MKEIRSADIQAETRDDEMVLEGTAIVLINPH